jgi:hypothetical protein
MSSIPPSSSKLELCLLKWCCCIVDEPINKVKPLYIRNLQAPPEQMMTHRRFTHVRFASEQISIDQFLKETKEG